MGITENGSAMSRGLCRPHPEERARCDGSANLSGCARVSKDEDGSAMALMLRDAALRAAPQHEGEGGKHQPVAVRNEGRRNSIVSDCYLQWMAQLQRVARNCAAEAQITSSVLSSVSP